MVPAGAGLEADPALATSEDVLEEARWAGDVHHEQVEVAVVIDVGDGASPARHAQGREVSRLLPLLEASVPDVMEHDGRLAVGRVSGLDVPRLCALVVADGADDARGQMPSDRVEVREAVVVEVGEVRAPTHGGPSDLGEARGLSRVLEESPLDVAVEAVGFPAEVRHEEPGAAGAPGVPDRHPHTGARAIPEDPGSRLGRRLLEGAVAAVVEEPVADTVVDEVQIRPSVAVVVERRHAKRLGARRVHREPGLLRHVGETPVPLVAIEVRRLSGVILGHAQLEQRLAGFPLGRRVEVVGDDDVHAPVAVVIEERRAHGKKRVLEPRVPAFLERPVAAVPVDGVSPDIRQVEVQPAVAVQVRPERAHPEAARMDAGALGDVLEPPPSPVAVEPSAALRVPFPPLRDGIGHVEVRQSVAVVVAESASAHHRRDHLQSPQVRSDPVADPRRHRDVPEQPRRTAARPARRRSQARQQDKGTTEQKSLHGLGLPPTTYHLPPDARRSASTNSSGPPRRVKYSERNLPRAPSPG